MKTKVNRKHQIRVRILLQYNTTNLVQIGSHGVTLYSSQVESVYTVWEILSSQASKQIKCLIYELIRLVFRLAGLI